MTHTTPTSSSPIGGFGRSLADARSDLFFALGALRMLTILEICPDLARDAELRISCALDHLADAERAASEEDS